MARLDQGVGHLIRRMDLREVVTERHPVFIRPDFWQEEVDTLPNPPMPITAEGEGVRDVPAQLLWWDGDNDIALAQLPAWSGTGHRGIYDSYDDEPYFDASRPSLSDGCVFIPSSAIDYAKSGLEVPKVYAQYRSDREWPSAPTICNLAQYGVSARVMGERLGLTRQAIHLAKGKLPRTITELISVYGRGGKHVPECATEGCQRPAQGKDSRYCMAHREQVWKTNLAKIQNRGHGKGGRPKRRALPRIEAEGDVHDFLSFGQPKEAEGGTLEAQADSQAPLE